MKKLTPVPLILALLATFPAHGQEIGDDTEARLLKLEKKLEYLPSVSGFINMRYQYDDANGTSHGFDVRRARIDIRGKIANPLEYRLHLEFAGNPRILDAYFKWNIIPQLSITAGQFKIPFTLENMYGPHQLETIDNSMAVTALCGYSDISGLSANGRDIGIELGGGFLPQNGWNLLEYSVGIFNGNGINGRDNNNNKDFAARLLIRPWREFTIGASHYNGSTGPKGDTHQRVRTSLGVKYDDGKLLIRSEFLHGKTSVVKSNGVYAVGAYFVHPKVQPLLKFDYFKENVDIDQTRNIHYTAGVNYFPIKWVRLQLNYSYRTIKDGDNSNYVALQIFGLF